MSSDSINSNAHDIDIDLRVLFALLWQKKWIIFATVFVFSTAAVFYALNQPNIYKSEALIAPVEEDQTLGGLQGQLGGLATLAGINLGGASNNKTQLALEIMQSRSFVAKFIERHNILPDLMAAQSWDLATNEINYNTNIYDHTTSTWLREAALPKTPEPSMQEAYKVFVNKLNISTDNETGTVTVSVEHISPFVARDWVKWLIQDINTTMKERDVKEAEKSTAFLTSQLAETKITDIREILYRLVEEQAKIIMFTNVRDEYSFKIIDPAYVPEEKAGPKRALICIIGAFLGGMLGIIIVIGMNFRHK